MSSSRPQKSFLEIVEADFPKSAIVVMCGLPATCKTWAATLIAERHGYKHLRTDLIRKEVLKDEDIFDEKVASDIEKRQRIYEVMFQRAEEIACSEKGVILDATFIKKSSRERAAEIASRYGRPLIMIHTDCTTQVALERISKRTPDNYESNAISEQAYYNNLKAFEPVDIEALKKRFPLLRLRYLHVETSKSDPDKWLILADVMEGIK